MIDVETLSQPLVGYLTVLRSSFPDAKILFLGREVLDEPRRLLFLGVHGFLAYGDVKERLGQAVRAIAAGQPWFPPEVLNDLLMFSAGRLDDGRRPARPCRRYPPSCAVACRH